MNVLAPDYEGEKPKGICIAIDESALRFTDADYCFHMKFKRMISLWRFRKYEKSETIFTCMVESKYKTEHTDPRTVYLIPDDIGAKASDSVELMACMFAKSIGADAVNFYGKVSKSLSKIDFITIKENK